LLGYWLQTGLGTGRDPHLVLDGGGGHNPEWIELFKSNPLNRKTSYRERR
jgi:hypothetical protein